MDTQILAIVALVVLVWTGIVLARGSLVGTALAVLLAGSCFGYAFFRVDVGRVPLSADRLLLLVLLGQYAIYRHWGRINLVPVASADYALCALLAALAASTFVHDYWADGFRPLATLTFVFLMPAVMYWTVRHGEWTGRMAWSVLVTLGAFGVYLCLTAVAENQGAWALVFPKYIASPEFGAAGGAARGPFLNPAATGLVQTLGMCAVLALWPRVSRAGRPLLVGLLGLFAWGLYSTHEPAVWLAAVASLGVIVIFGSRGAWRLPAVSATVGVMAIVAGVFGQQLWMGQPQPPADVAKDAAQPAGAHVAVAWRKLLDRPILGVGLGQYPRETPAYLMDRSRSSTQEPAARAQPGMFLTLAVETGLLGLGLFVTLLICWTRTAWRLWRAVSAPRWARQLAVMFLAFLAAYVVVALFHDLLTAPLVNMFLFFLGGAVTALTPWLADPTVELRVERWRARREPELVAS